MENGGVQPIDIRKYNNNKTTITIARNSNSNSNINYNNNKKKNIEQKQKRKRKIIGYRSGQKERIQLKVNRSFAVTENGELEMEKWQHLLLASHSLLLH